MPPRRVGGQPLHPIYALIALRRRPSYAVSMKMPSATCHGPGVQSLFITPHGDSLCNGLTLKSAELANQPGRHSRVEAPRGRLAAHERICRDHAALAHDRAEQQDRAEADPRAFLHADRRGLAREDAKQPFRAVAVLMRAEGPQDAWYELRVGGSQVTHYVLDVEMAAGQIHPPVLRRHEGAAQPFP